MLGKFKNVRNVGSIASNLLDSLNRANNIINPPQELKDLMLTKLYIDDSGDRVARYLTDTDIQNQIQNEIAKQNTYLEYITTSDTINAAGQLVLS